MADDTLPNLLHTYLEIGQHMGLSARQVEHLDKADPTFPTFKLGRIVCARRTSLDEWLRDREAQAKAEGRADA